MTVLTVENIRPCVGCRWFYEDESEKRATWWLGRKHSTSASINYGVCGVFVVRASTARSDCKGDMFTEKQPGQ